MYIKTVISFIAVFLFLQSPCAAQDRSPLKFNETQWDFGTIREEGGPVTHSFEFTNAGANPVAIDRVNASCGCTTPEYPRSLIQPGGKGIIKVSFDPMGYPGDFSKSVIVISGGAKNHDMLIISGHVTPRIKPVEEEYPFEMGGGVRLDNTMLAFRQVPQGASASMVVKYINTSAKNVSLEILPSEPSGLIAVSAPATVCGGCKGDITFTYDLTDKTGHYGMIHDVLQVTVDGVTAGKTIYTSMIGIDDFSGQSIEIAPKLFLDAQFHNFGEVRRRTMPYVKQLTITNTGDETLVIRSIVSKPGVKTTLRDGITIAPGADLPFELLLYSNKYESGDLNESLIMIVNDPLRPVREIRVAARIK